MQSTHPASQQLAAYKSGKLPEPDASTIEAHLSNCDTCCDVLAQLNVTNPLEKRLRGKRPSVPTVDQPVQDWIDELRDRNPLAKTSRDGTDEFLKRLAPAQSPDELGRLGRYRILKQLGRGGMGSVYLAHDTKLQREVALKIPRFTSDDEPRYRERFLREARAAAALDHPNICPIYEADEIDGVQYISMAYIDGKPLSEFIPNPSPPTPLPADGARGEKGSLPAAGGAARPGRPPSPRLRGEGRGEGFIPQRQVAAVIRELALALEEAHARGIIHRDLKPSNIMVNKRRKLVIMDFGLAGHFRLTDAGEKSQKSRLTSSGMIIGTPAYMSPEQATGEIAAMGPGCDIYSLGVIMYELLTGERPFDGPPAAVLGQIMVADPPRPSSLRPDLDPQLEAICLKAISKKPTDRFTGMSALAQTLGDYLAAPTKQPASAQARSARQEPKPASSSGSILGDAALQQFFAQLDADKESAPPPVLRLTEASRPPTSRARQLLVAIASIAAVLLGGIVIYIATDRGTIQIELTPPTEGAVIKIDGDEVSIEIVKGPITLRTGDHQVEVSIGDKRLERKITIHRGKNPSQPFDLGGHFSRTAPEPTGKEIPKPGDTEPSDLLAIDRLEQEVMAGLPHILNDPRVVDLRSRLVAFHQKHRGTPDEIRAAALMPQITWPVDVLTHGNIADYALEIASGGDEGKSHPEIVAILGDGKLSHWHVMQCLAFSSDANLLISAGRDGTVRVWDPANGRLRFQLEELEVVWSLAISHDGQKLALGCTSGQVKVWDLSKRERMHSFDCQIGTILAVAFSPDGNTLATAGNRTVKLWSGPTWEEQKVLSGHSDSVRAVLFSNDGQTLFTGSADKTVKFWDLPKGIERSTLKGHPGPISALALSPDGAHLVSASEDGTLIVSDTATGEELRAFEDHAPGVLSLSFHPKGELLALGSADKTAQIWDVASGKRRNTLEGHGHKVISVAFEASGDTLATTSYDGGVFLWEVATGKSRITSSGHTGPLHSTAFSPDGVLLATSGRGGILHLWDVASGEREATLPGHRGVVIDRVSFTPDGKYLASVSEARNLIVHQLETQSEYLNVPGLAGGFTLYGKRTGVAISSDGRTIAAAGKENTIELWDLVSRENIKSLVGHGDKVDTVAFSSDGRLLASASDDQTVKLWDVANGKTIRTIAVQWKDIPTVAISPDGQLLAAPWGIDEIRVWNLSDDQGDPIILRGHKCGIMCVTFNPTGNVLAASGWDGSVWLWSAQSGKLLKTIPIGPPQGGIHQVCFSPEGRHLATANFDGTVYLIRLAPPCSFASLTERLEGFEHLFNEKNLDGWVVESGDPGAWRVDKGELVAIGGELVNRGWLLTSRDFSDYVLRFDFKLAPSATTSLALRTKPGESPFMVPMEGRPGNWNAVEVTSRGDTLQVSINGQPVPLAEQPKYTSGRIGFENSVGTVRFRSIQIKESL